MRRLSRVWILHLFAKMSLRVFGRAEEIVFLSSERPVEAYEWFF
jgi:hypothetical protein